MPGWKIKAWDRASGRGTIVSAIGTIDFDASVATADDFVLDEEVDVALTPNAESYRVTCIAPSRWREISPSASLALGSELETINAELFDRDATVVSLDRDGRLELELSVDSYAPEMFLVFEGCQFIQLSVDLPHLSQLRAFAADVFVREHKALTEAWPELPPNARVYRLEPRSFRDAAGYVVALRVSLVGGPR